MTVAVGPAAPATSRASIVAPGDSVLSALPTARAASADPMVVADLVVSAPLARPAVSMVVATIAYPCAPANSAATMDVAALAATALRPMPACAVSVAAPLLARVVV